MAPVLAGAFETEGLSNGAGKRPVLCDIPNFIRISRGKSN